MSALNKGYLAHSIISDPDGRIATIVRDLKGMTLDQFRASLIPPGGKDPDQQTTLDVLETVPLNELAKRLVVESPEN